jgi:hypothetical protein
MVGDALALFDFFFNEVLYRILKFVNFLLKIIDCVFLLLWLLNAMSKVK